MCPAFSTNFRTEFTCPWVYFYSVIIGIYEVAESCSISLGIVTRLIPGKSKECGSIPGTAKKFFCTPKRPYRVWIPTCFLFGEYREISPWVVMMWSNRGVNLTTLIILVSKLKMIRCSLSPIYSPVVYGNNFTLKVLHVSNCVANCETFDSFHRIWLNVEHLNRSLFSYNG